MMVFAFALMAAAGIAYHLLCVIANKHRDAKYGATVDEVAAGMEAERTDLTDGANKNFRYTY